MVVLQPRRLLRAGAPTVLAMCLVVSPSGRATAASCMPDDVATVVEESDAVFVGTVTSVEQTRARIRVSDVWEGSVGSVVVVDGGSPGSATSVDWEQGRQYVVLTDLGGPVVPTSRCAGTRPVDDATIATLNTALGPATPLGRGAGTSADGPTTTASSPPTPTDDADERASAEPTAAEGDGEGLSTAELAAGILLGLAVLASFLLPQLRRHNRERRRERREGSDAAAEPPEPDDPAESWRR